MKTSLPNAARRTLLGAAYMGLLGWSAGAWGQGGGSFDQFWTAIVRNHVGSLERLVALGFDVNSPNPDLEPALVFALKRESWEAAAYLASLPSLDLEAVNPTGENALMLAALKGQTKLVAQLLERGAQANRPGWTPLHYAATHEGDEAATITQMLLEKFAYIDAASPNGTTPLMMAARYGHRDVVKMLLDQGADPGLRNQAGLGAIEFALQVDRSEQAEWVAAAIRARQPKGRW